MRFIIADTFPRSLEKLDGESKRLVKQAAFEFQMNPANPGFQFHKLERCKDKRFSSARVNRDIRLIVHRDGAASIMLCYVDHHDAAYAWAERRVLDVHPKTGALQLVEVEERVQEVIRQVIREQEAPLLARHDPDYLLALGVPPRWLDAVRCVGESGFLELLDSLPNEVAERLLQLADGKPVPRPAGTTPDPYAHPDSRMHFRVLDGRNELAQALDAPWEQWLIFLHPDQQRYAEQDYNGPARVFGGAGAGKTVVAVHRAVRLARRCHAEGGGRVLLTTYTRTLAQHLRRQVKLLAGDDPALALLDVAHLHGKAAELLARSEKQEYKAPKRSAVDALLINAASTHQLDSQLVRDEFWAILDAQGINTKDGYLAASRTGRGTPMGKKKRLALWPAFEGVLNQLQAQGERTWNGLMTAATTLLGTQTTPPYQHVLVDESQDFGPAELAFIRALCSPGVNDVFLCGDEGQRIYKAKTSWTKLGLPVTGRSHRLNVNYRTTAQIRRKVDLLLPKVLQDGDGEDLVRGTVSPLSGQEPELSGHRNAEQETKALTAWLKTQLKNGLPAERIAIFARSQRLLDERALPAITAAGLACTDLKADRIATGTIAVGTMHRAKGLEFRAVAILGVDEKHIPAPSALAEALDPADREAAQEQERNLLYVACTRAREQLRVSWAGKPSPLLVPLLQSKTSAAA